MNIYIFLSKQGGVGKRQIISNLTQVLTQIKKRILIIDLCRSYFEEILDTVSPYLTLVNVNSNYEEIETIINKFQNKEFDFIIINSNSLPPKDLIFDNLFLITTPYRISLLKIKNLLRDYKRNNSKQISLLVNKVGENKKYEYSLPFIEKINGLPIFQEFPYDLNVIKSEQLGLPLSNINHEPKFILAIIKFLMKITNLPAPNQILHILNKNKLKDKKLKLGILG